MKKVTKISLSIFAVAIGSIFISEFSSPAEGNLGGAPGGRAGDPFAGNLTCAAAGCHTGATPIVEANMITTDIPSAGYKADSTYTITAKIMRVGHTKFGFEVSPQNAAGTILGTLISTDAETQLVTGNRYVTHKATSITGTDMRSWTFDWTAPATGNGPVTFYGAFNAANNNGSESGDTIFTSTTTVAEDIATSITDLASASNNVKVFPNPVEDYFYLANLNEVATVTISNVNGAVLKVVQNVANQQAINVADFAAGIYSVAIKTASFVETKKIVKK